MDSIRKKIVAANWKMNTSLQEGKDLFQKVIAGLPVDMPCQVIIAPPATHLAVLQEMVDNADLCLSAQNCFYESSGAFTGEISPSMIKSLDIDYVIIGHSERRHLFHESNEIIKKKIDAALAAGLKPIFCCGESLEIRQAETHNIFVRLQLEESLFHLEPEDFRKLSIAYEPIWAIGTGINATPEQAQEMHMYIRDQLAIRYDKVTSESTRILYGGSIKADNAKALFSQEDVDGGLVGGASLDATGFLAIINAAC